MDLSASISNNTTCGCCNCCDDGGCECCTTPTDPFFDLWSMCTPPEIFFDPAPNTILGVQSQGTAGNTLVAYSGISPSALPVFLEASPCPHALMPIASEKSLSGGLVSTGPTLGAGQSVWFYAKAPAVFPNTTVLMSASGSADTDLWTLFLVLDELFVQNGDTSVTVSLGTVTPNQNLLIGLEIDPVTPSYRIWVNGVEVANPAFPAGSSGSAVWAGQSGAEWWLYWGAVSSTAWGTLTTTTMPDWITSLTTGSCTFPVLGLAP